MAETPVAIEAPRANPVSINTSTVLMTVLLGAVALGTLTPILFTILGSFDLARPGEPSRYGLDGWAQMFSDPTMASALWNTVTLAVVRQSIALVVGVFLAWLIARTDIPGKNTLEFMFWVSFFLPTLPMTMGWILLLDPHFGLVNQWLQALPFVTGPVFNIYSFWGITWVHLAVSTLGIKVMLLAPAFRNLDAALEETSRSCGVTAFGTFRRIVVPIMIPPITVSAVLGLIRSLEAYEIELLLGVPIGLHVYSTKIADLVGDEPPEYAPAMALSAFFLVFLLLLVAFQRWYVGRRMYRTVSGKGFSIRPTALEQWKYPAFVLVTLLALLITVVPTIVLIMGTFMSVFGFFNIPEPWTLANWQRVLDDSLLLGSFKNTIVIGIGTALGGVVIYSLVAYVIVKSRFAGRALLDFLSWLPWAIPGVVMGLALLWTVFKTQLLLPLYGTVYLLMLALIIKSMPFGVQITKSVLLQLGDELEEASRITGASWLQTYRRVVIPLLTPTLVVVGLVGFMSAARDISTVVLLGSSQSRTLALLSLDFAFGGQFERATVVAVLTVILVIVAALLARLVGGKVGIRSH